MAGEVERDPVVVTGPDEQSVVVLTLNRPARHNALSAAMIDHLNAEIDVLADDERVRAVVVTGAGASFCSGVDIHEDAWRSGAAQSRRRRAFRRLVAGLGELPFPAVAAVEGHVLGAGLEIALACDIVVAAEESVFGLPELSLGVVPGGGGVDSLIQRSGRGLAALMLLGGRRIDARRMHELGAIDVTCGQGRTVETACNVISGVAAAPRHVVRANVELVRGSPGRTRVEALAHEDALWRVGALGRAAKASAAPS